jgi:hypothetical protein
MDLYDMLFGSYDGTISVHAFKAAMVEYLAGEVTATQIVTAFLMDGLASADLYALLAKMDALSTRLDKIQFIIELDSVCILAEQGLRYTTKSAFATRLGI